MEGPYNSEAELISQAKAGDNEALTQIVLDNESLVYNTALKLVANKEEAECVLQETFLKVFQAISDFKEQSSLSTWIYRIATNFALMKLRARKKQHNDLEDSEKHISKASLESFNKSLGTNPFRSVVNDELRKEMENAIDELPDKFRTVFILKDIEGYSLKEIADMLDMTLAAVKSNLHRARLFLRDRLAEFTETTSEMEP